MRVLVQRLSFKEYGTKTIVNKAFGLHFNSDEFFLVDVIYEYLLLIINMEINFHMS